MTICLLFLLSLSPSLKFLMQTLLYSMAYITSFYNFLFKALWNYYFLDFLPKAGKELTDAEDAEVSRRALENQIAELVSQTNIEEQECQAERNIGNQVISRSMPSK